ncbi:hypothetical protein AKJ40_02115 [candidate division MSBL1 archaeon SCGC-AAA259M10]|uniref:Uncharacterized protein n=1 Tax=candidate division MSBL1 archaeon SCGC-AAA259M10 TaxID=1698270 RepID=A0A133V0L2_9EURY|nr:hypothetical protein AKJ40_02115 [candidate division MSBL1 archaeon SCGC-AAA259M10]
MSILNRRSSEAERCGIRSRRRGWKMKRKIELTMEINLEEIAKKRRGAPAPGGLPSRTGVRPGQPTLF